MRFAPCLHPGEHAGILGLSAAADYLGLRLCGLAVDPGMYVAFFPPKVLADPVRLQSSFPPLVADAALPDSQYRGHVMCRQHAVGAAESTGAALGGPLGAEA